MCVSCYFQIDGLVIHDVPKIMFWAISSLLREIEIWSWWLYPCFEVPAMTPEYSLIIKFKSCTVFHSASIDFSVFLSNFNVCHDKHNYIIHLCWCFITCTMPWSICNKKHECNQQNLGLKYMWVVIFKPIVVGTSSPMKSIQFILRNSHIIKFKMAIVFKSDFIYVCHIFV